MLASSSYQNGLPSSSSTGTAAAPATSVSSLAQSSVSEASAASASNFAGQAKLQEMVFSILGMLQSMLETLGAPDPGSDWDSGTESPDGKIADAKNSADPSKPDYQAV